MKINFLLSTNKSGWLFFIYLFLLSFNVASSFNMQAGVSSQAVAPLNLLCYSDHEFTDPIFKLMKTTEGENQFAGYQFKNNTWVWAGYFIETSDNVFVNGGEPIDEFIITSKTANQNKYEGILDVIDEQNDNIVPQNVFCTKITTTATT